jgi:hypothetical protein
LRLLLAAILVLYPLHVLERPIVEPLVPLFRSVISALDQQFVITDARIDREGRNEVVRFRANLRQPTRFAGRVLYPFGWEGVPGGGYEVNCPLGGVLQYSGLLLILAMAWPARRSAELAVRLGVSLLFVGVLLLIDVPTTVVAELRHAAETLVDPHALSGWMIWSRFLMGGGGIALSILLAVLAIGAGRTVARRRDHHETDGQECIRPERQRTIARS